MGRSRTEPAAAAKVQGPGTGEPKADPRRAVLIALAALVAFGALAAGVWWLTVRLNSKQPSGSQAAELAALNERLDAVNAAITPIAVAFTSEPATGAIDVASYRARIASARRLVDEVNGIPVTDPDALQVRDLIVTGGSQVLTGLDLALDAAESDDASATQPAALEVEAGMQSLKEARDLLDTLTGRTSLTWRLPTGIARAVT
jgi:hypothetical protein